jgi:hypothetical protein
MTPVNPFHPSISRPEHVGHRGEGRVPFPVRSPAQYRLHRVALDLDPNVPAMLCDARQRDSVKEVLITLVQHVLPAGPVNGHRASDGADAVGQPGTVT